MSVTVHPKMTRCLHHGFTVIELIVVIALMGVLLALLLPAVQASREAARSTQCKNNLKQIAIALHHYHDRRGSLPPSSVVDWNMDTGWWSWIARILPELDERALYEQIDLGEDVWTNCHGYKACTSQRLTVLLCPSDTNGRGIYESDELCPGGEAYALTSYLGCRGSTRPELDAEGFYSAQLPSNGVFPDVNRVVRFAQILDGAAQTILVGERAADPAAYWGWWAAGRGFDDHGLGDYVLDTFEGPRTGTIDDESDLLRYGSVHPNGVNFAMCDGSVRYFSNSIHKPVFLALGSRNGGEVVAGY